jgi:hypothetical protein
MADTEIKFDYTREELIAICERATVPVEKWRNRDSAGAQQKVGLAWVMLKAGADFYINPPRQGKQGCHTNSETIWVDLYWPGFQAFEYGRDDHANWEDEQVYLPTPARLEKSAGNDWY